MMGGSGGSMGGIGEKAKGKRPINVKFEIPYFTTSGIQVRYLKIIEPKVSGIIIISRLRTRSSLLTSILAAIFVVTLGQVYHAVGRHSGASAGRASSMRCVMIAGHEYQE